MYGGGEASFGAPQYAADGSFTTSCNWYNCRELFHQGVKQSDRHLPILFVVPPGKEEAVISYMRAVEDRLGLAPSERLGLDYTNKKQHLLVTVGYWWSVGVRWHVMSVLLRVALCPDLMKGSTTNLYVQNSVDYYNKTREAIEWFLNGNTNYWKGNVKDFSGWLNIFGGKKTPAQLKNILRPEAEGDQKTDPIYLAMMEFFQAA